MAQVIETETVQEFFKRNEMEKFREFIDHFEYVENIKELFAVNIEQLIFMGIPPNVAVPLYNKIQNFNLNKKQEVTTVNPEMVKMSACKNINVGTGSVCNINASVSTGTLYL